MCHRRNHPSMCPRPMRSISARPHSLRRWTRSGLSLLHLNRARPTRLNRIQLRAQSPNSTRNRHRIYHSTVQRSWARFATSRRLLTLTAAMSSRTVRSRVRPTIRRGRTRLLRTPTSATILPRARRSTSMKTYLTSSPSTRTSNRSARLPGGWRCRLGSCRELPGRWSSSASGPTSPPRSMMTMVRSLGCAATTTSATTRARLHRKSRPRSR
ncbi:Uncharacterised protein [Mycobacteroides abscessus subsp. bolletii]|nr:Uncharacterised protein [Mycobacteroides abscessus subsp. bolletii]